MTALSLFSAANFSIAPSCYFLLTTTVESALCARGGQVNASPKTRACWSQNLLLIASFRAKHAESTYMSPCALEWRTRFP